ncbi:LbetaH domain-containing protein [Wolbachia endosymbiont of Litomosoides brasiliensis]|uniref:hypothetical protein n=1 Tax=Wolbachia endosymbiont of Litomosoides brasiliensis TaxID=1812117 RepID=UPI001FE3C3F6|nr:hypothetical protein [Wolbachia endosymbiont of Litomosoides brasiliensis]
MGDGTNIQGGAAIHVDRDLGGATVISTMVIVGHFCMLHACTVYDKAFISMGSIVMGHAVIEHEAIEVKHIT